MKPLYAVLILTALFVALVAVSWLTWANPVIDSGREMNAPLRILQGETLYSEVYYLYGPVAPWFNAFLYKAFGAHLNTLYAAGLIGAFLLVLVIFELGRSFMPPFEAMLAAATVILLSAFKQGGTLIFPYSYSALYGALVGALALLAGINYVKSGRTLLLVAAGGLSGIALCCKIEFGFAATACLLALAISSPSGERVRTALISLGSLLFFPLLMYGIVFARVPSDAVVKDTFLLPGTIPAELLYFNRMKLGLNNPGKTFRELLNAIALLAGLAGLLSLAASRMAGAPISLRRSLKGAGGSMRRIWTITLAAWGFMLAHVLVFGTRWDLNPFRALPVLLLAMIVIYFRRDRKADAMQRSLLIASVYGLAVLARVVVRVPAGGAYGAGLIPIPLLLFFYAATADWKAFGISPAARSRRRRIVLAFVGSALVIALGVLCFRQAQFRYERLETPRGDLRLIAPIHQALREALDFIARETREGEHLLSVPEGSSINFLAGRPAPLRYEILTPGFLTEAAEQEAIKAMQAKRVRFVFVMNRSTAEFGARAFGRDYCRTLMRWIEANYTARASFGEGASLDNEIGDPNFFIKCYERNDSDAPVPASRP